jgi:hypothetical protein
MSGRGSEPNETTGKKREPLSFYSLFYIFLSVAGVFLSMFYNVFVFMCVCMWVPPPIRCVHS